MEIEDLINAGYGKYLAAYIIEPGFIMFEVTVSRTGNPYSSGTIWKNTSYKQIVESGVHFVENVYS